MTPADIPDVHDKNGNVTVECGDRSITLTRYGARRLVYKLRLLRTEPGRKPRAWNLPARLGRLFRNINRVNAETAVRQCDEQLVRNRTFMEHYVPEVYRDGDKSLKGPRTAMKIADDVYTRSIALEATLGRIDQETLPSVIAVDRHLAISADGGQGIEIRPEFAPMLAKLVGLDIGDEAGCPMLYEEWRLRRKLAYYRELARLYGERYVGYLGEDYKQGYSSRYYDKADTAAEIAMLLHKITEYEVSPAGNRPGNKETKEQP
jgi:hypothetical protein